MMKALQRTGMVVIGLFLCAVSYGADLETLKLRSGVRFSEGSVNQTFNRHPAFVIPQMIKASGARVYHTTLSLPSAPLARGLEKVSESLVRRRVPDIVGQLGVPQQNNLIASSMKTVFRFVTGLISSISPTNSSSSNSAVANIAVPTLGIRG
jgi:hypothetical protein